MTTNIADKLTTLLETCMNPEELDPFVQMGFSSTPAEGPQVSTAMVDSLRGAVDAALAWQPGLRLYTTGTHHGSGNRFANILGSVAGHSVSLRLVHDGVRLAMYMSIDSQRRTIGAPCGDHASCDTCDRYQRCEYL